MQESINPILNKVAQGRKRLARMTVLMSLASIPCAVFKKVVESTTNIDKDRQEEVWGGLGVLSQEDEHAVSYEEKGSAMVLLDQFTGAALNNGYISVDSETASLMAQVEPFNTTESLQSQRENKTGWHLESGDILALFLSNEQILWLENTGMKGQSIHSDFGAKYLLSKRDDLAYLDTFQEKPHLK